MFSEKFKKVLRNGIMGILVMNFIITLISIVCSFVFGDDNYYPMSPQFQEQFETEITAVTLQFILSSISGFLIGVSMLVWESEQISLTPQTIIHFFILLGSLFPVAWICYWMQHTIKGLIIFSLFFVGAYIIVWIANFFSELIKIRRINNALKKRQVIAK